MAAVVIENLSKVFPAPAGGEVRALTGVSLSVADGEFMVLVGPSGSGKTTLLRMIAGLEQPSSGGISIGGVRVDTVPAPERAVSMVFQEHSLYPHMTVRENLAFGLMLRKAPKFELEERVREAADLLGLASLLGRKPPALSGGERQRVALGRSMVLRPRVFLLDEPLSNLDAPLRAQMRREIARLHRRLGITMIYVTHDQAEAMNLADRIAVIQGGVIQGLGSPLALYHKPPNQFVASFIGAPPMNLFTGTLVRKGNALWFRGGAAGRDELPDSTPAAELVFKIPEGPAWSDSALSGKPVTLGLRPEHIRQVESSEDCAQAETTVKAAVEAVEPMGWETHVWLRTGSSTFAARSLSDTPLPVGASIFAALDLSKAHFFDAAGGQRIG